MTVVSLNKAKKHLVSVCFDSGEEILLDSDVVSEAALCTGAVLTEEDIVSLKERSEYTRAKSRALWHLDSCDHTARALYDKLVKAGFDKKASAAVIARLQELGMVDDRRFAQRYAERCERQNISRRAAYSKMLQKGVPKDIAEEILSSREVDEVAQVRALIDKKYRTKMQSEEDIPKVYAALVRRGFSYGSVREAINKFYVE